MASVPFVVECAQSFRLKRTDNIHIADDIAHGILGVVVENGLFLFEDTSGTGVACTPFLCDDTTFVIDIFRIKGQVV